MRTNEEELELFADLLEPVAEILTDNAVRSVIQSGGKPITAIKWAIKNHKKATIEILARLDDVPVEEYKVSAITLPIKLLALVNKPEVQDLFSSAEQMSGAALSGSATEVTQDGAH